MRWHSVHVHFHGEDIDRVVLDAVRPLFARLRPQVDRAYFVRHWQRGPHLRLHLRCDPDRFEAAVYPQVREVVGGYLAELPSRAVLDPQRLLPMHERLAELEHEPGPLLPFRPDNTLHIEPYDRRLPVLGGEAAAELLAEFLSSTTELAFEMTAHVRDGGQRLRLAFDLMIAVAHALSGSDISRGFASYRSHAEAFLSGWPEAVGQRAAWDRHYHAHAPELVTRMQDVVASLDRRSSAVSSAVPFVGAWVEVLGEFQRRGRRLIEAGELSMDPPSRDRLERPAPAEPSPLHRAAAASEAFQRYVRHSPAFAAYRLALNYNYLQLTRLGVTPAQRFLLCHLAASAVEQHYGRTALDLLRELDESVAVLATPAGDP